MATKPKTAKKPKTKPKAKPAPAPKPEKRPRGGQTVYRADIADAVLRMMACGMTLNQSCKELKLSPSTVRLWALDDRDGFAAKYARARDLMLDYWADDLIDICDDGTNDWMERRDADGNVVGWQVNGENIQRSRLRVDTRKWTLSKLRPDRYGDKVSVDHSGKVQNVQAPQPTGEDHLAEITQRYAVKAKVGGKTNGSGLH